MIWQRVFYSENGSVSWEGKAAVDGEEFIGFLQGPVASRLNDEEGKQTFTDHLYSLSLTGMGQKALEEVLEAEIPEMRDWTAGEALAEAVLESDHNVIFPWNMERDKRNPYASLPGADIVGFQKDGDSFRLAVGEVKSSSETKSPPQVLYGKSGMTHQLEKLANDLETIYQLIEWLLFRVKKTKYENAFNKACERYLNSNKRDLVLFGILVRDQEPRESDLESRAFALAEILNVPTQCCLIALYLPWSITQLPKMIHRKESV